MEHILKQALFVATKTVSFKLGVGPGLDDLIQFMLHLKICYEKKLGKLDDDFFYFSHIGCKIVFSQNNNDFCGQMEVALAKTYFSSTIKLYFIGPNA
jgi:hypothetical protein